MTGKREVIVVADADALATTAAERLLARLPPPAMPPPLPSPASGGGVKRAAVALTGGSSPEGLYRLLAQEPYRSRLPWERVHWFIGDDRFVPPDDPLSNMGMARRLFLDRVKAPPANIHPMATTAESPEAAAQLYESELKHFYGAERLDRARPLFDLVLMGLGSDGHTASLFPGAPALDELADLAADRRERGKLLFVALLRRAAKKLRDPEGVRVEGHRRSDAVVL